MSAVVVRLGAALLTALAVSCYESDSGFPESRDPGGAGEGSGGGHAGGASCGDGVCDAADAETCERCPADCGECGSCDEPIGVDYATQIVPILESACVGCHTGSSGSANLDLASYAGVMGVVTACDCAGSVLTQKCGPNPPYGDRMPKGGPPLSDGQRALLCQWIDQGATETYEEGTCGPPSGSECAAADCGDGVCGGGETCEGCAADCGECAGQPTCIEPAPGDEITYGNQIREIFKDNDCDDCHGDDDDLSAGLDLSTYAGALSRVRPCDCESSLLFLKTTSSPPFGDRMPLGEDPLGAGEMATICEWINQGARP